MAVATGHKLKKMTLGEGLVEFSAAMLRTLKGKAWGVVSEFDCPLCGGKAKAFASPDNGRRRAKCFECGFRVAEHTR